MIKLKLRESSKYLFLIVMLQFGLFKVTEADFSNGDFENKYVTSSSNSDPISGWTNKGYVFKDTNSTQIPTRMADITLSTQGGISPGGILDIYSAVDILDSSHNTSLFGDYSPDDYFLYGATPTPTLLLPGVGLQAASVNLRSVHLPFTVSGWFQKPAGWVVSPNQATAISQQITIKASDIDPRDDKVHIRFIAAPVLEEPTNNVPHTFSQMPFFAVQLNNKSTDRNESNPLFFQWNYSTQPGVPWEKPIIFGSNNGSNIGYHYTGWQGFDISPGNAYLHVGDTVELVVLASGCSKNDNGGHDGHLYIDDVTTLIPSLLWVSATGPATSSPGSNITYIYTYTNGADYAVKNVVVVANMPQGSPPIINGIAQHATAAQNTSFVSYTPPTSGSCTIPPVGGTGPVTCSLGTLQPGQIGSFTVTVAVPSNWSTSIMSATDTTGPVNNGNYPISGDGVKTILGPLVQTSLLDIGKNSNLVANTSGLPTKTTLGVDYSGSFTCSNPSNTKASGKALSASCNVANLPIGLTVSGCTITPSSQSWSEPADIPANETVTCRVTGKPTTAGSFTATVTTNSSNNTNNTSNTSSTIIVVSKDSSDMVAIASWSASAQLSVNYSGSFSCKNDSAVTANAVFCGVSGLPDGIIASCGTWVNGSSLAANQSVNCTISGTPKTIGVFTPTVTTSASNEVNTSNNSSINTITVANPSDVVAIASFPATAFVAGNYTGSFSCKNNSAVTATSVSCGVSGLPDGVTASCGSWVNGSSLAANQSVSCTVSGAPKVAGTFTPTVTTSASNEVNTANNTSINSIIVNTPSDVLARAQLPATAQVSVDYNGSFSCKNNSTVAATAVSCGISGLPDGLIASCGSWVNGSSLAANQSVQCTVSGSPKTSGTFNPTVNTSASNEINILNNTSSNSVIVSDISDVVAVAALPPTAQLLVNYQGSFSCKNSSAVTATAVTCGISGLPDGVIASCGSWVNGSSLTANQSVQCTVSGTPKIAGSFNTTITTSASNEVNTINNISVNSITVNTPSDVVVSALLPATAIVSGNYTGSFSCKNKSTVTANAVTCVISGLPDGVTASCGSWVNGSSLAANQSVQCTVSGSPKTAGSFSPTVTTSSSNEVNTANNTSINSLTVNAPSDVVVSAVLPAITFVSGNYTGSFSCKNNSAVTATAVTCGISGLPDGVTASCGSWVNGSSLATNQLVQCTVSGSPKTVGTFNPTVTTSASNEVNTANNTSINSITVNTPADVVASAVLPATAIVSGNYTGSFSCKNIGAVTATTVSCGIAGLPDGVTASCGSWVNGSSLAANQSVQCTVSGSPKTAGTFNPTVTTSTSNEVNISNNISINNVIVGNPSDVVVSAVLPTTAFISGNYTGSFSCKNNSAVTATAVSCVISGLPDGVTASCGSWVNGSSLAANQSVQCTVSGSPKTAGSFSPTVTTSSSNEVNTANNTSINSLTVNTPSDVLARAQLPATAQVSVDYKGSFSCKNNSSVTATAVTCGISGLPDGVTASCGSWVNGSSLAANQAVQCIVSGLPKAAGSFNPIVTTSASNEVNTANNTSINSIIVNAPSDVLASAALPTTAIVSGNYVGSFSCKNIGSVTATTVSCGIVGLPDGVTASCGSWVNGSSLAANQSVQCTVSGSPKTAGSFSPTVTTSTSNEVNISNNISINNVIVGNPSDVVVSAVMPTTAFISGNYTGSFSCKNNSAVTANAVTCGIAGLPDGVTASCGSWVNGSSLAANQSVQCTVSGSPKTAGSFSPTVTTSSSNEVNTANNTSINSLTVNAPSDVVVSAVLPAITFVSGNYTGSFSCKNNSAVAATAVTCGISGLPDGVTASCGSWVNGSSLATNQLVQCTVSGSPKTVGTFNPTVTTSASNEVNTANNTSINSITVNTPADVVASAVLPATAIVSGNYTGSFSCKNIGAVTATTVSCGIAGLPDGVTASCGSWVNGSSLAANQSVQCTVSGSPKTAGTFNPTVTTSTSNEVNISNNVSINNVIVGNPSDVVVSAVLPTTAFISGNYTGSFSCKNNSAVTATAVNCVISGLPDGVTASCGSWVNGSSLAANQSVQCTVSGSPKTAGSFSPTVTTSSSNEVNTANNTSINSLTVNTPSDVLARAQLPATAQVSVDYKGSFSCKNNSSVTATAVTCGISGLPDGVTASCGSWVNGSSLAANQAVQCTVSGKLKGAGMFSPTATTSASNEVNTTNNVSINNILVDPPSDIDVSSTLPTKAVVSVNYTGSFSCKNNSSVVATGVNCGISGLPEGVTATCGSWVNGSSLAAGQSVNCTVSGKPKTAGNVTATVTASASNEINTTNNINTTVITTQVQIIAILGGSPLLDSTVVCCGSPVILSMSGTGQETYTVTSHTGDVSCEIGTDGLVTYLKMRNGNGTCTIVGTKNGVTSAPLTVQGKNR